MLRIVLFFIVLMGIGIPSFSFANIFSQDLENPSISDYFLKINCCEFKTDYLTHNKNSILSQKSILFCAPVWIVLAKSKKDKNKSRTKNYTYKKNTDDLVKDASKWLFSIDNKKGKEGLDGMLEYGKERVE